MARVSYCSDSTIIEAWATVRGVPVPLDEDEAPGLVLAAKKVIPTLADEASVVVARIPDPRQPVPAFWNRQVSWDQGRCLSRVGHRYLSVHVLADDGRKYERYEESFLPSFRQWLELFRAFYGGGVIRPQVDAMSFGYVNAFRFPVRDFDLSQAFRLNIGVDVESAKDGLSGMDLRFAFRAGAGEAVSVQVTVGTLGADLEMLEVKTKVSAESHALGSLFLDDPERIENRVHAAKETAKRVFFEIATASTHEQMGAHYDD